MKWGVLISLAIHVVVVLRPGFTLGHSGPRPLWIAWIEEGGIETLTPTVVPASHGDGPLLPLASRLPSSGVSSVVGAERSSSVEEWTEWGNPPPDYPYLAQQRGWQGRVELRVTVGRGEGEMTPAEVRLVASSGHDLLDNAALEWARHCRIKASSERPTEYYLPIEYRLED